MTESILMRDDVMEDIRGIRFEAPRENLISLNDLFRPIKVENCYWSIDNLEIHCLQIDDTSWEIDYPTVITGEELKIKLTSSAYQIFGEFTGYLCKSEIEPIHTYDDFLRAKCDITILIVDSYY